jgi:Spy/CpxP family protein refolding chaperone
MKSKVFAVCVIMLLAGASARAQKDPVAPKKDAPGKDAGMKKMVDPVAEYMVGPEFLFGKGGAPTVELTAEQKAEIQEIMHKGQEQFKERHHKLSDEMTALGEALSPDRVDEQKALEQLNKMLDTERDIKRARLSLAIAIKNKLTPEQLARVREIKEEHAKAGQKLKGHPASSPSAEGAEPKHKK